MPLMALTFLTACANKGIQVVRTDNAPEPIGPYEQGVIYNGVLYCSGQIGIDPKTNQLVAGGTISEARQAFNNIKAVIEASNTKMDKILKTNIYLINMDDFNEVNALYTTYFSGDYYPARAVVEVSSLPKGASIEIEATVAL